MINREGFQKFLNDIITNSNNVIIFNPYNKLQIFCPKFYYYIANQLKLEEHVSDFEIKTSYPETKIVNAKIIGVDVCNEYCVIELVYDYDVSMSKKEMTIHDLFKHNQIITVSDFNKYKHLIQENGCSLEIINSKEYRIKFPNNLIPEKYRYYTDCKYSCEDCKYCDYDYHNNVEYCIAEKEISIIYQSSKYICNNFKKKESY